MHLEWKEQGLSQWLNVQQHFGRAIERTHEGQEDGDEGHAHELRADEKGRMPTLVASLLAVMASILVTL